MRKKLFKLIFIFMMGFIILPINSFAKDAVEYRYYDETTKEFKTGSCDDYEEVVYTDTEWTSGWYVLSSRTGMDEQSITVTGDVNLILIDGMELYDAISIVVSKGNSLTIYAQSDGENMGHLNILWGRDKCAGIGGFDGQDAGTIIIHGGKITSAAKYLGAGIGGGYNGDGGTVIIYGGQIDVSNISGYGAAGIGGGYNGDGGIFKMYGGTLKAKGSWEADISAGAAIGGGHNGDSGVFEYYGGKLEVDSTNNLAAIGPGKGGSITKAITIGDDVTLFDKSGNLIGDRFMFPISDIFNAKSVKVEALSSKDYPITYREYNADGTFDNKTINTYKYLTINDTLLTDGWYVVSGDSTYPNGTSIGVSGNVNLILEDDSTLSVTKGIRVSDGNTLTVYTQSDGNNMGKINVDSTNFLNAGIGGFNSEKAGNIIINNGNITAIGGNGSAGIGGGYNAAGGNVTMYNGILNVTGGTDASAIGGGYNAAGGNFTIYRGKVTVTSGNSSIKAIGAGKNSTNNGFMTVADDAKLVDTSSSSEIVRGFDKTWNETLGNAASFTVEKRDDVSYLEYNVSENDFTEKYCSDYKILDANSYNLTSGWYVLNQSGTLKNVLTINGDVKIILMNGATLNSSNAGIRVNFDNILTIYSQTNDSNMGSIVAMSTNKHASGIGGASGVSAGKLIIHGGNITAVGGENSAGIGGGGPDIHTGTGSNGMNLTIYGGNITAIGGANAAGIGGGYNGNGRNTVIYGGTVNATGGTNGAAGLTGNTTVHGGNADFIGLNNHDGIENSNVIISPKNESFIYVRAEDEEELGESPFDSETNITSLVATHNEIHLKDSSDTLDGEAVKLAAKNSAINLINAMKSNDNSSNVQKAAQNAITAIQNANSVDAINDAKRNGILSIQSAKIYNENFVNPKTGDSLVVYILMLIISLFTISGILVINKKENN